MPKVDDVTRELREQEDRKVVAALASAGVEVESVFDLVNARRSSPPAPSWSSSARPGAPVRTLWLGKT